MPGCQIRHFTFIMIKRPALRYYGGKWKLAKWIILHMPPHEHYIEPCFGAGSVLLQKEPAKLETVNDLNGRIVNYFRMLRDRPEELIRLIELTPWARDEYNLSKIECENELEDARRFHILCWMSINGGPNPTGFRTGNFIKGRGTPAPSDLINHSLKEVANRLKTVQILNDNALDMIDRYVPYDDYLIYFDPPYIKETRSQKTGYANFEVENSFHVEMAEKLIPLTGLVIVSGYQCNLYKELYEQNGFSRVDSLATTNGGQTKTESLWLSPLVQERLSLPEQGTLL